MQAERLVNGCTVVQETADSVTYWHVELDRHGVLLAEGVAAESYLDTGNRAGFSNGDVFLELHPDFGPRPADATCAPIAGQDSDVVRAVRWRLLARAEALGWTLTEDPAPWLECEGRRIEPQRRGERYRFAVPADARWARLRSRATRPSDLAAGAGDTRLLGLMLNRLTLLTEASLHEVALDNAGLSEGFSYMESEDGWAWRWTDGNALLPLEVLLPGQTVTVIEIAVEIGLKHLVASDYMTAGPIDVRLVA